MTQTRNWELCETSIRVLTSSLPGFDPLQLMVGRDNGQEVLDSQILEKTNPMCGGVGPDLRAKDA